MSSEPLNIVCFKWRGPPEYRSQFNFQHVNVLYRMICRHYLAPFRMHCVTDNPDHISPDIVVHKLWDDHAHLQPPNGFGNPSCYRRLKVFSAEAAEMFGPRIVTLDLDTVIVGDMRPVWDRPDDIVLWGDTHPTTFYNGSMILLKAGSRKHVWETFDPDRSPAMAKYAGHFGSDQGWISFCLGPHERKWGKSDGVYSFRNHIMNYEQQGRLPAGARIVFFHGGADPWGNLAQTLPWVRDNWR